MAFISRRALIAIAILALVALLAGYAAIWSGNYNAMCTGCHLTPGAGPTELSRGLYPAPPNLTLAKVDPARAFWVIKHGIKASGMPAWGKSMQDEYVWNMVAFLQVLPSLDAAEYQAIVDRSGGHAHGGGESDHSARAGTEAVAGDHDDSSAGADHHAPVTPEPPPSADDAHDDDHQH